MNAHNHSGWTEGCDRAHDFNIAACVQVLRRRTSSRGSSTCCQAQHNQTSALAGTADGTWTSTPVDGVSCTRIANSFSPSPVRSMSWLRMEMEGAMSVSTTNSKSVPAGTGTVVSKAALEAWHQCCRPKQARLYLTRVRERGVGVMCLHARIPHARFPAAAQFPAEDRFALLLDGVDTVNCLMPGSGASRPAASRTCGDAVADRVQVDDDEYIAGDGEREELRLARLDAIRHGGGAGHVDVP